DWDTVRWPHTLWMRLRRSDPLGEWIEDMAAGQARIPPADLAWLRALPEELELADRVWVCHGMPGNPWNSIWPRSPVYDANVSAADRQASLQMLAKHHIELVLCGHIPSPVEYRDRLSDGRPLHVIRAGPRDAKSVSYAIVTRRGSSWTPEWHQAEIAQHG
ncbi:MAG TPA: hypothetical protein VFB50_18035, partial [Chloroflexota bacterium]|nr:hypothetical protein [Chloroflexota bacterium]